MIELHVDPDVSSGYLKVSWCVDKQLLASLAEDGIQDPILVFSVAEPPKVREEKDGPIEKDYWRSDESESRHCVRLKDLEAYVPLHNTGSKQVFAFIDTNVDGDNHYLSLRKLRTIWENYQVPIYNSCRDGYYSPYDGHMGYPLPTRKEYYSEKVIIDVPEDIFASKIAEWEKAWLEWMLPVNFYNECQLRKYRLFGYTIQPCLYLLSRLPRLVPLILFLFGGITSKWENIKTFFSLNNLSDYLKEPDFNSIFIRDNWTGWKKYIFLPFTPILLVVEIVIGCAIYKLLNTISGPGVLSLALILLISLSLLFFNKIRDKLYKLYQTIMGKNNNDISQAWYLNDKYQQVLICDGTPRENIPNQYKTLSLRINKLKTKVCRPFAQK